LILGVVLALACCILPIGLPPVIFYSILQKIEGLNKYEVSLMINKNNKSFFLANLFFLGKLPQAKRRNKL
ncbi:MAG: hypothetical protein KAI61_01415, partial [Alphaproteobacteria bacterium]|nr:hypothetical protein [Alphaproteobacteria bacterium]